MYQHPGEMAEPAEGARLLSECGGKLPPRVRIPLSPPFQYVRPPFNKGGLSFWRTDLSNRYNEVRKSVFGDCFDGCGLRRELLIVNPRSCE